MDRGRVLITDGVHEVLPKGLQALGYALDYEPDISLAEVRRRVGDYDGMVINSKVTVDEAMLSSTDRLRWVGRLGSGLEIIDRAFAKTRGVAVISSPEGNAPAVAEHATGMLLALLTKLRTGERMVRDFAWDREGARGLELRYRTVGIIGYGHTGPAFAKTLRGFGCAVLAWDKYRPDFTAETPWVTAAASAEEVLAKADVISLHLPLTRETVDYLDAARIAQLQPGTIVLNTSRGLALDLGALLQHLRSGHVAAAGLDVFPNEKPATYSAPEAAVMRGLAGLDQVVMTPHVAGWTAESKYALAEIVLDRVRELVTAAPAGGR